MDPIQIILSALQVGSRSQAPSISQVYAELKVLVLNAFGENVRARRAFEDFLEDPDTYERPLAKALTETGADKNEAILRTAGRLLQHESPGEFDVLQQIAEREKNRTGDRFTRQAQSIAGVKAQEEAASRQRMEQYWEAETQRRAEIAERQARTLAQQRRMLIGVIAIGVVVVIVFIAVMIVASRG
ncbi:MAG TPA: hypothetical protein VIK33_10245 [Anaerolineae bacterium]